ncbi:13839_t:CDS:2 [Funneliformis mosseae]|uniref:13839_t:CDS:1 n=1 Tax=Funneliformis mosseae TaxID=27381 RepID=A0A9N9GV11_FUNMO|nr:13839_t:CDS:2 [Funneliformis mosseae]
MASIKEDIDISEISLRTDVATIGSNESFQLPNDDVITKNVLQCKRNAERILEVSHKKIDSNIKITYTTLIDDVELLTSELENKSKKPENGVEETYSNSKMKCFTKGTVKEADDVKVGDIDPKETQGDVDNTGKEKLLEENIHSEKAQPVIQESMQEIIIEKTDDYINDARHETSTKCLDKKFDESNECRGNQIEDVRNRMTQLSDLVQDIKETTTFMEANVKELQGFTKKFPDIEKIFKTLQDKARKNADDLNVKFDEQNERFNGQIKDVLFKYDDLAKSLIVMDRNCDVLKKLPKFEQLNQNSQEQIRTIQIKSEELERKANESEISLRDKLEKLGSKIDIMNTEAYKNIGDIKEDLKKFDNRITLLKETEDELENRLQKEIRENEKNILQRLEEDRAKKLALIITSVKEEAENLFGRLDILESSYEDLRKEVKECDDEIMKRVVEDRVMSDQIIRDSIKEAIDSYATEYDAKVTQRIHEAIELYEERVNKLADTSFELEATFNEEIQKTAERRIHAIEEENKRLKEHKRVLKNKLETKEAEFIEFKIECDRNDGIIARLGNDKTELEKKVQYIKNERKQLEFKVREMENQIREMGRIHKENLADSDEEIRKMKVDMERLDQTAKTVEADKDCYKKWLNVSFAVIIAHLMAIVYLLASPFENSWYLIANIGTL